MLVKEFYETRKDGVNLYRSYSDQNLRVQKVGTEEIYDEAIDVETANYVYVETDMPIEYPPEQVDHEDEPIENIEQQI